MFFLLRTAFWVSALLLVLPLGSVLKSDGPNDKDRATIDGMAALAAAGATISDVSGFCARQPGACDVGAQALKVVGERAAAAAAGVQTYLASEKGVVKPMRAEGADAQQAQQAVPAPAPSAAAASRSTLTSSDRKPAWRAPAA